jgi:hypothetical protein
LLKYLYSFIDFILYYYLIPGLEIREYGRGDPLCCSRDTLYPQTLALTSPTIGGLSVGIVRLRTQATEFFLIHYFGCNYRLHITWLYTNKFGGTKLKRNYTSIWWYVSKKGCTTGLRSTEVKERGRDAWCFPQIPFLTHPQVNSHWSVLQARLELRWNHWKWITELNILKAR